ncbi:hypothetical protein H0H93_003041 [Arthromyces matolae]|nr:hypothetical protein H0H93_003041 [Arthromyces matolae]
MGRRVMESYILLLLTPSPSLKKTHILDEIISRTLNPYSLRDRNGVWVGASVAHRLFHTRILPLLVNRSLPQEFINDAQEACQRLGGEKGKLLLLETSTSREEAERLVQPAS